MNLRIQSVRSWFEALELARPYTIAFRTVADVELGFVELHADNGLVGRGCASPEPFVTGETREACRNALDSGALDWLVGEDVRCLAGLIRRIDTELPANPAARAALDMALHDLLAQALGLPLADVLGRCHDALPTSITIGIKDVAATLSEAEEYIGRGFRVLKVKLGHALDEDVARLRALREAHGDKLVMRVDPNQGYSPEDLVSFANDAAPLGIEFIEQPAPVAATDALRALPESLRAQLAADESLLDESAALHLLDSPRACGIFNIKLMKCGGVRAGLRIAAIAEAAGISLMWGCMDESRISIAAALHAAFASPATRYLDLDGSLDLARDIVTGGFTIENGIMRTTSAPGLGVAPI